VFASGGILLLHGKRIQKRASLRLDRLHDLFRDDSLRLCSQPGKMGRQEMMRLRFSR